MKRIERRAGLCLLLAAALVLGLGIFTFRELRSGGAWAASPGARPTLFSWSSAV